MNALLFIAGVFTFFSVLLLISDEVSFRTKAILFLSVVILNEYVRPILIDKIFL